MNIVTKNLERVVIANQTTGVISATIHVKLKTASVSQVRAQNGGAEHAMNVKSANGVQCVSTTVQNVAMDHVRKTMATVWTAHSVTGDCHARTCAQRTVLQNASHPMVNVAHVFMEHGAVLVMKRV